MILFLSVNKVVEPAQMMDQTSRASLTSKEQV